MQSQLAELWRVAANYTHLEREITDPLQPGIEVDGGARPCPHSSRSVTAVSRLSITPSVELAGDRWSEVTGGGYARIGDYTLLNLQVAVSRRRYVGRRGGRYEPARREFRTCAGIPGAWPQRLSAGSGSSFRGRAGTVRTVRLRPRCVATSQSCRCGTKIAPSISAAERGSTDEAIDCGSEALSRLQPPRRQARRHRRRRPRRRRLEHLLCGAAVRGAGEPEKLLGVALDALSLDSENECLVVSADDDALRRAPGFDREAPPPRPEPLFASPEASARVARGPRCGGRATT